MGERSQRLEGAPRSELHCATVARGTTNTPRSISELVVARARLILVFLQSSKRFPPSEKGQSDTSSDEEPSQRQKEVEKGKKIKRERSRKREKRERERNDESVDEGFWDCKSRVRLRRACFESFKRYFGAIQGEVRNGAAQFDPQRRKK